MCTRSRSQASLLDRPQKYTRRLTIVCGVLSDGLIGQLALHKRSVYRVLQTIWIVFKTSNEDNATNDTKTSFKIYAVKCSLNCIVIFKRIFLQSTASRINRKTLIEEYVSISEDYKCEINLTRIAKSYTVYEPPQWFFWIQGIQDKYVILEIISQNLAHIGYVYGVPFWWFGTYSFAHEDVIPTRSQLMHLCYTVLTMAFERFYNTPTSQVQLSPVDLGTYNSYSKNFIVY